MKAKETTISSQMRKLFLGLAVLIFTVFIIEVFTIVYYQFRYQHYMHNLTTASEFNQDFKQDIDLKMYYYVIGSKESEGLPMKEVEKAKKIAEDLISSTSDKDSKQAITSVINLCGNLEDQMREIEFTASYDQRQIQLKNNIYVLTSLIEEYMYRYIYSEAVLLNTLQGRMNAQLTIGLILMVVGVTALFAALMQRSARISRSIAEPIEKLSSRVQEIGGGDLSVRKPVESQVYEVLEQEDTKLWHLSPLLLFQKTQPVKLHITRFRIQGNCIFAFFKLNLLFGESCRKITCCLPVIFCCGKNCVV